MYCIQFLVVYLYSPVPHFFLLVLVKSVLLAYFIGNAAWYKYTYIQNQIYLYYLFEWFLAANVIKY